MRIDLRLSHKGFILISVPLIFEIMFVFTLGQLLKQAEADAWQENRSKEIIARLETMQKKLTDAGMACAFYVMTKKEYFARQIDSVIDSLPKEEGELKTLIGDDPQEKEAFDRITVLATEAMQLLQEGRRMFEQGGKSLQFTDVNDMRETYQITLTQLVSNIHAMVEQEKKAHGLTLEKKMHSNRQVEQALYAGVVLNILLAALLAVFFNRGTARRLEVLMDNTRRLASQAPLNPPLIGADEIGRLDKTFHEMAAELKALEKRKQELVAMVSHDLRTPLTSIQCILTLLATGVLGELPHEAAESVNEAEAETTRLIKLINDLLDIERMEAGKIEIRARSIPLQPVVEKSVAAVRALAEKSKVSIETPEQAPEIYGDDDRIVQVLVNLLSNAIKFSPEGSTVRVAVAEENDWVEVKVIDQGRGVPKDLQKSIFEKFEQVEVSDARQKGGTGLGLPICKSIIESHGGTIGVNSESGQGSIFWFRLPRAGRAAKGAVDMQLQERL